MTDDLFVYEEDKLLRKRPSVIRERQLEALEFRALFEEAAECVDISSPDIPVGSDAFRFVKGGKHDEAKARADRLAR
jgi:hypothetical protein